MGDGGGVGDDGGGVDDHGGGMGDDGGGVGDDGGLVVELATMTGVVGGEVGNYGGEVGGGDIGDDVVDKCGCVGNDRVMGDNWVHCLSCQGQCFLFSVELNMVGVTLLFLVKDSCLCFLTEREGCLCPSGTP